MPADPLQGAGLDCWEVCEHCGKVRVKTNVLLFHSETVLVSAVSFYFIVEEPQGLCEGVNPETCFSSVI